MNPPPGYEKKFADFIRLCSEAKAKGTAQIVIGYPWALGDNYEELIESLSRLADAGLTLHVGARKEWLTFAVTNARFARLHGLPVGPVPFTTPPDPPPKSRARHGRD